MDDEDAQVQRDTIRQLVAMVVEIREDQARLAQKAADAFNELSERVAALEKRLNQQN